MCRPGLLGPAIAILLVAAPARAEQNLVEPLSNGLKLSMTAGDIKNTFGEPTDPSWDSRTFGYKEFSVQTGGSRNEIWRVRLKSGVRLSSGIGPGSTRADVKRVFGSEISVRHGQYELTFEYNGDRVDQVKIEPANGSFVPHAVSAPSAPAPTVAALVGKWHGNSSPIELRADGTYTGVNGASGRWRIDGTAIVFDGPLAAWNGGRAQFKEGRIEFLWKDAKGAYWFWFAK